MKLYVVLLSQTLRISYWETFLGHIARKVKQPLVCYPPFNVSLPHPQLFYPVNLLRYVLIKINKNCFNGKQCNLFQFYSKLIEEAVITYWNSFLNSLGQCLLKRGPGPTVEESTGNLLKIEILWQHYRSTELETLAGLCTIF